MVSIAALFTLTSATAHANSTTVGSSLQLGSKLAAVAANLADVLPSPLETNDKECALSSLARAGRELVASQRATSDNVTMLQAALTVADVQGQTFEAPPQDEFIDLFLFSPYVWWDHDKGWMGGFGLSLDHW